MDLSTISQTKAWNFLDWPDFTEGQENQQNQLQVNFVET